MFIKKKAQEFLVAQVYVDDIIFGRQLQSIIATFMEHMKTELEMSIVGELSFFLGFQIRQCKTGIFIYQEVWS